MRTLARNYAKKPHTASFLQTFHSGIGSNAARENAQRVLAEALALGGDDNAAEYELASVQSDREQDLLDLVPAEKVVDRRTTGQVKFMEDLIGRISALDTESGRIARDYTDGMTERGLWVIGRGSNTSVWIDKMLGKERQLKATTPTVKAPQVADGRYAIEEDGVLKFFRVKNGSRGFVWLDVQASDDWHSVRNMARIHSILALIAEDPKAAMIRYGHELGVCGKCGRTLTDEASRAAGIGPVCRTK